MIQSTVISAISLINSEPYDRKEWVDLNEERGINEVDGTPNIRYGNQKIWSDGIVVIAETSPVSLVDENNQEVARVEPFTTENVLLDKLVYRTNIWSTPVTSFQYKRGTYFDVLLDR